MTKTNAMRLLDMAGIAYRVIEYPVDEEDLSGVHAAALTGLPPEQVFKTLVLQGVSGAHYVCCIPVAETVDLKKLCRLTGEKSADLIPMKQLLPLTGYVRGGCSPIGMKKQFPTFIDETAVLFKAITVCAGVRGALVLVNPQDLLRFTGGIAADLAQSS
jgi:Cys-tRNA(Pro)/Cys-tRNA(Cys) deacylase